jgi:Flp pilus assembly protein TadG
MPARRLVLLSFWRDGRGISAVEFALVAPVLLVLSMGLVEIGRFAMLTLKLQHAATTLADLATREETMTTATLDALFNAVTHITRPFVLTQDGVAVVTLVGANNGSGPRVYWQRRGVGSYAAGSTVGATGGAATLPSSLAVRDGETLLTAEVVFHYRPWLLGIVPDRVLRRTSYYRPRMGALATLS